MRRKKDFDSFLIRSGKKKKIKADNLASFPLLEIKDVTDDILLSMFFPGVMKYCMVNGMVKPY